MVGGHIQFDELQTIEGIVAKSLFLLPLQHYPHLGSVSSGNVRSNAFDPGVLQQSHNIQKHRYLWVKQVECVYMWGFLVFLRVFEDYLLNMVEARCFN